MMQSSIPPADSSNPGRATEATEATGQQRMHDAACEIEIRHIPVIFNLMSHRRVAQHS